MEILKSENSEIKKPTNSGPMSESKIENPDSKPDLRKLDSLANQAASDESAGVGFMTPGTKAKKGPGRPKGTTKTPKTGAPPSSSQGSQATPGTSQPQAGVDVIQTVPTQKIVEPFVKLISRVGVGISGDPRAAMSPDEIKEISWSMGLVVDKWAPLFMTQYSAEMALVMTMGVWGSRVYALKQLKIEEKKAAEKAKAQKPDNGQDIGEPQMTSPPFGFDQVKETREGYL